LSADWVVVEGPSYGSQGAQQGHHERAGLWWMVADKMSSTKAQWIVVAPTSLKKYATGKGNASKDQVLSAAINRYREFPVDDNNVADALVLAAMGRDALGIPLATVPKVNRDALDKVQWPVAAVTQVDEIKTKLYV
jgi:crossover junction endodeoxyribonuclease RuvC